MVRTLRGFKRKADLKSFSVMIVVGKLYARVRRGGLLTSSCEVRMVMSRFV